MPNWLVFILGIILGEVAALFFLALVKVSK